MPKNDSNKKTSSKTAKPEIPVDNIVSLLKDVETIAEIDKADNKKLCWLFIQTDTYKNSPVVGAEMCIIEGIVNRLYPEFDGETITVEEWGWKTPEGEIRYLKG